MRYKNWNGRAFASLCSLSGFVLLLLSAIILYLEPHGRVAYWTRWHFWGLQKDQWGNLHIFSGLLFITAGGFHLYYNWKPLARYLSGRIETGLRYKRELMTGSLILIWIIASGIWSLPPLIYMVDLSEDLKSSWVASPEVEPPFGHAEMVGLGTFCRKQDIPLDQAIAKLRNAGFKVENPAKTLESIADSKGTSAMEVYQAIKELESKPEVVMPGSDWTPESIAETFSGTGLGRKTVGRVIRELGLDGKAVYQRLKRQDIKAREEDTFKKLADRYDSTPIRLLIIMLIDN